MCICQLRFRVLGGSCLFLGGVPYSLPHLDLESSPWRCQRAPPHLNPPLCPNLLCCVWFGDEALCVHNAHVACSSEGSSVFSYFCLVYADQLDEGLLSFVWFTWVVVSFPFGLGGLSGSLWIVSDFLHCCRQECNRIKRAKIPLHSFSLLATIFLCLSDFLCS